MLSKQKPMRFAAILAATILWLVAAIPVAAADTLTPTPVTTTLVAGTSTTVNKTLSLDGLPARADIIVAIDTTASMGGPIAQAQADANSICTTVQGSIPGARFAVVALGDYPTMPFGVPTRQRLRAPHAGLRLQLRRVLDGGLVAGRPRRR